MELDTTDRDILEALTRDGRASYRDIAKEVGVSTPTVSRRVQALEELGLVQGYGAVVDPVRAGETVTLLLVEAAPGTLRNLAGELADAPGVREVLLLAGSRLHVRVHHRETRTLHAVLDLLDAQPGVRRVDHHLVRELAHGRPSTSVPADVDVPCHQCDGPIRGPPVRARLGDREHVFCCRTCREEFVDRYERLAAEG